MATLFLISVVILFIWLQSKQTKLNWIHIITFLLMIGIITYTAPQPMTRDLQAELLAVTLFLSLLVFGKVEELQFVMRVEFYILQMENSIPFHGFF